MRMAGPCHTTTRCSGSIVVDGPSPSPRHAAITGSRRFRQTARASSWGSAQRMTTCGSTTSLGGALRASPLREATTVIPSGHRTVRASPTFSPAGRWIAYVSDEAGVPEVYVQSFPGPGRKTQVSIRGGITPFWRRDGRELVYRDGQRLIAVSVTTTPTTLQVGQPEELLRLPPRTT